MQLDRTCASKPFSFRMLAMGAGLACGLAIGSWSSDAGAAHRKERRDWTLETTSKPDHYELSLSEIAGGSVWANSRPVSRSRILGLGAGGLSADQDNVTLRFKRDAGTIVATGAIRDERGEGTFEIELDPAYAEELVRQGIGRPTPEQQRRLLHADVPLTFLEDLKSYGYPLPPIDLLVRCADHGVDQEFVRELAGAGYRLVEIESLIEVRDHGVDKEFIDGLAAAGFKKLPIEELVEARDHGVDPEYLAEMRAAGFDHLTLPEAIRARDHGVDGAFAKKFHRREGRTGSLDELIHARDIGG